MKKSSTDLRKEKTLRLYQERNFLDYSGKIFHFDTTHKRQQPTEEELDTKPFVVDFNPTYGPPGPLAYRITDAIFIKLMSSQLPVKGSVSFRDIELCKLGGISRGGQTYKSFKLAFRQLWGVQIQTNTILKNGDIESEVVGLFQKERTVKKSSGELHSVSFTLTKFFTESLNDKHFHCFNWTKIQHYNPTTRQLYKSLFRYYSKRLSKPTETTRVVFRKSYRSICADWLGGLVPRKHASKIKEQLNRHFSKLEDDQFIEKWWIEPSKTNRGDFNICALIGQRTIADYFDFFVNTPTQPESVPGIEFDPEHDAAIDLLDYFQTAMHGQHNNERNEYSLKELNRARFLLATYGQDGAQSLVDFATRRANRDGFPMRSLTAVQQIYQPAWSAASARLKREQHHKMFEGYRNFLISKATSKLGVDQVRTVQDETNFPNWCVRVLRLPSFKEWLDVHDQ